MTRSTSIQASIAAIAFFTLFSTNASAQHIPDYSLSPAETARQPNINENAAYQNYLKQNGISDPRMNTRSIGLPGAGDPITDPNSARPSTHFMDGYCDRNFSPAIARDPRYASMATCLKQQKEQVCTQFQALPDDVKNVLDESIGCTYKLLNGENPDEQHPSAAAPTNCGDGDPLRLQLLKKYWREPNTAYALVFLPDDVLDSSSKCIRGSR